jgi:hypothetical protein
MRKPAPNVMRDNMRDMKELTPGKKVWPINGA